MSKAPTGLGSQFKPMKKISVKLNKTHWCTFEGECKEELNLTTLCWSCIWMQKFDIPALLEEEIKNGRHGMGEHT